MDGFSALQPVGRSPAPAPTLTRMPLHVTLEQHVDALRRDGVLVIENALSGSQLERLHAELDPVFDRTPPGEGEFVGRYTRRFGGLLAKAPSSLDLILHPRVLPLCERLLIADDIGPARCDKIQLSTAQAVAIGSDERSQVVHRDQKLYWLDPGFELLVNAMFCLDDFSLANGATRFAPGSSHWERDRWPTTEEIVAAEAPAGSVILWVGSMIHGGGANKTAAPRRGVIVSYSLGWLQQMERLLLSTPPEIARTLPTRAQQLIGYQAHYPNLGCVEGRDPIEWLLGRTRDVAPAQDHLSADDAALIAMFYAQQSGEAAA